MATASWRTVEVWDLAPIKTKPLLTVEHPARVVKTALGPGGKQLATASEGGNVTIWNVERQERALTLVKEPSLGVKVRERTFEEARGAQAAQAQGVAVTEVEEKSSAYRVGIRIDDVITSINGGAIGSLADFSEAVKRLQLGSEVPVELIRKAQSTTVRVRVERGVEVSGLAFSPDGTMLAVAYENATIKLWDDPSGREGLTLAGHRKVIKGLAFSPNGKLLATASADWTAEVWDLSNGKRVFSLRDDNEVNDVAFSPNGKMLATAGRDHHVHLWDSNSGQPLFNLSGHTDSVSALAFAANGADLVTASEDKTVKVWEIAQQDGLTLAAHEDEIWGLAFSPNGKYLATASLDGKARLWDFNGGEELLSLSGHKEGVRNVAFGPDGKTLFTASEDRVAKIWDATSGRELKTLHGHTDFVLSLALSRDGSRLATASRDGTARLWDAVSGEVLFELSGHQNSVLGVAFSPDGKLLATSSWDKSVKVWDVETGKEKFTLPVLHQDGVWGVAFTPDGRYLASASRDGTAILWDLSSQRLSCVYSGHAAGLNDIAVSPDGRQLATAGADGSIVLWDVLSCKEKLTLSGEDAKKASHRVAFSPDGRFLAAGRIDGTVDIYPLPLEDLVASARRHISRSLTTAECQKYLEQEHCPKFVEALDAYVKGETLARADDIVDAAKEFGEALKKDPALGFDPEKEAIGLAVARLAREGSRAARAGHLESAVQSFQSAKALNPELDFDRLFKAQRLLAAMDRLAKGANRAKEGNIGEAIALYREAKGLDPALNISVGDWNALCWYGSLHRRARDVMFACERAVELAPSSVGIRDSRGVARALAGDLKGAIEDFEFAIADPKFAQRKPRQEWLAKLRKGKNPLTQEQIKILFNE